MKRYAIFLWALAGLIGMSCSKSAIVRKYYVLEALQNPAKQSMQPLPLKLDVRDFTVAKAFDQTRIALRTKSNELNYYYYHLWAVRPATAVADMMYEIMAQLNLFQRCTRGYSIGPDYYISGQVMALERSQAGKKEYAHIMATLSLFDARSELPVLQHNFDQTTELRKDKSMNGFAGASSRILHGEMELFLQKIIEYYQTDKP
jgi:ABC-type uncharacterized transport system auxiliary subunit